MEGAERKVFSEYTKKELEEVIRNSTAYIDILDKLRLHKGYHTNLVKFVKENSIDISHFRKTAKPRRTIEEILVKDSHGASSSGIKKYLIKNNLVKNECSICKLLPMWNNKPLVLQLDHINGDHYDNRVENLRLICPNCHSQTDTFTGKNLREYKEKFCGDCKKKLKSDNVTGKCAKCIAKEKHLCSVCKVNTRSSKWTKCKDCRENTDYKLCKKCNKPIKRAYNDTDYHRRCCGGEKL